MFKYEKSKWGKDGIKYLKITVKYEGIARYLEDKVSIEEEILEKKFENDIIAMILNKIADDLGFPSLTELAKIHAMIGHLYIPTKDPNLLDLSMFIEKLVRIRRGDVPIEKI